MRKRVENSPGHITIIECNYDREYSHPHVLIYNKLKEEYGDDRPNVEEIVRKYDFNIVVENPSEYKGGWRFYKHRTERTEPNANKSAKSVWESIVYGVEKDDLISICNDIEEI